VEAFEACGVIIIGEGRQVLASNNHFFICNNDFFMVLFVKIFSG